MFLRVCVIILIILLLILVVYRRIKYSDETFTKINLGFVPQNNPDTDIIPARDPTEPNYTVGGKYFMEMFNPYLPRNYTDIFGNMIRTTGKGQTFAITASFLSVWDVNTILKSMTDNGVRNKTVTELLQQIKQVDATSFEGERFNMISKVDPHRVYTDLTVPLSNGISQQVEYLDVVKGSCDLELMLQCLLSALPDANIIIFYYGANPTVCPPEGDDLPNQSFIDLYESVPRSLYSKMYAYSSQYTILCNNIVFDVISDRMEIVNEVARLLTNIKANNVTILTTSGMMDKNNIPDGRDEYQTYPMAFSSVTTIAGFRYENIPTQASPQLTSFKYSNGGFFTLENVPSDDYASEIPYFQIGYIPQDDPDKAYYVGKPDVAGIASNVFIMYTENPNSPFVPPELRTSLSVSTLTTTSLDISLCFYAVVIGMVNEITAFNGWDYQSIFYEYSQFIFEYKNRGDNGKYQANHFKLWNPCTGLGMLNGKTLANLLGASFVYAGLPIQCVAKGVSRQMSYINCYPLPFVNDVLYPSFNGNSSLRLSEPSFGPMSLWSELFIYPVSKSEEGYFKISTPTERDHLLIRNASLVVIVSRQVNSTPFVLCNIENRLHTITDNKFRPGDKISDEYVWFISSTNSQHEYIRYFSDIYVSSYSNNQDTTLFLSCKYDQDQSPSLLSSEQSSQEQMPVVFYFSPHPYYILKSDYNKLVEKSYYINITNQSEFVTCGLDNNFSDVRITRNKCADPYRIVPALFQTEFDPVPQWLLIPSHNNKYPNNIPALIFGRYLIFNTRLKSYLTIIHNIVYNEDDEEEDSFELRFKTPSYQSTPLYAKSVFNLSRFDFVTYAQDPAPQNPTFKLFQPRHVQNKGSETLNNFMCNVWIDFENPHYTNEHPSEFVSVFFDELPDEEDDETDLTSIQRLTIENTRTEEPNFFLFWVAEHLMIRSNRNTVAIITSTPTYNNQVRRTALSITENSFVEMTNYDSSYINPSQVWKIEMTPHCPWISNMFFFDFQYPILNFLRNNIYSEGFILTSAERIDNCLIYSDQGNAWKPRLGYCESTSEKDWAVSPNYTNTLPSDQEDDGLSLSGNYFYLNSLYNISGTKGVMSSVLPTPHQPGLFQLNDSNLDTTYYNSAYIIRPINILE